MTAKILDGRTVASRLWRDLSDRVSDLHERTGATPRLAIVRLDARGPSAVYAASVWRAARSVGVDAFGSQGFADPIPVDARHLAGNRRG